MIGSAADCCLFLGANQNRSTQLAKGGEEWRRGNGVPREDSWVTQQVSRGTEATRLVNRKRKAPAGRVQKLHQ